MNTKVYKMLFAKVKVQTGMFGSKKRLVLDGCCATVKTAQGEISLIVRAAENNSDPTSIIQVFKFDTKKKERSAEFASIDAWGAVSSGNMQLVSFTGKKFGTSSYLITISNISSGEYGVIVNPNLKVDRVTISYFGVK